MTEAASDALQFAAFLSYSRGDRALCERVHRGLELLARPFFRLRARRVFRDAANISAADSLKGVLNDAIAQSRYFVLLASPGAASSEWVDFEIAAWLRAHEERAHRFLIVLCDGDIIWDQTAGDFDWTTTTALPRTLEKRFDAEPIYCDLRGLIAEGRPLKLRHAGFRDRLAEIVAPLEGRNKEDIVGRHLAVRRQIATVVGAVALILAVLGGGLVNRISEVRRQEAIDTARQRLSRSADVIAAEGDPDNWSDALRAALADAQSAVRELMARLPALAQADETYLRAALAGLPGSVSQLPVKNAEGGMAGSDGRRILLSLEDGGDTVSVWDVAAQREIGRLPETRLFSDDLRAFAWNEEEDRIGADVAGVRTVIAGAGKPLVPLAITSGGLLVYAERSYTEGANNGLYLTRLGRGEPLRLCDVDTTSLARFSRDDTRLAAICGKTARVWNVATNNVIATFEVPAQPMVGLAFNADGTRLALGTYRRVLLWAIDDSPRLLADQKVVDDDEDEDFISRIGLDPIGGRVAVTIDDEVIFCFDALSGQTIFPKLAAWQFEERGKHKPDPISPIAASRMVAKGFALFDTCAGTRLARVVLGSAMEVSTYNDESRLLAVANKKKEQFIVNLRPASVYAEEQTPGEVRLVRPAEAAPVHALATATRLWVWDVERGTRLLDQHGEFAGTLVALSSDGETLATLRGRSLTVCRCLRGASCGAGGANGPSVPLQTTLGEGGLGLSVTADYALVEEKERKRLFRVSEDGLGEVALQHAERPVLLDAGPDGRSRLLFVNAEGSHLFTSELQGETVGPLRQLAVASAGDFGIDKVYAHLPGSDAVIVFGETTVRVVDSRAAGAIRSILDLRKQEYPKHAVSEDGRFLAIAASPTNHVPELIDPDVVEVLDLQAGQVVTRIELPTHVASMRFGHTGHLAIAGNAVARGDASFRLRVYEPRQWTVVTDAQMPSHPESLAFGPDDALIAVGQRDSTTAVINRAGVRVLNVPQRGRVVFCEFFDNGTKLATIGSATDQTTLQLTPASRAALAQRLLQLEAFVP